MADISIIVTKLAEARDAEARAKAARVALEAELAEAIGVPETWTGSTTSELCGRKITCTRRENVKIDAAHLEAIFRDMPPEFVQFARPVFKWSPEIVKKSWDVCPEQVLALLKPAITRTPGKITFTFKDTK